jgi:epoxyqueuosine reductase
MDDPRPRLLALARDLGFSAVRFTNVGTPAHAGTYERWLADGFHGEMAYLERGRDLRLDPLRAHPTARSAMVLSLEHHHAVPPDPGGLTGRVARYAWGRDYHNLIGKRLKKLRRQLDDLGIHAWGGVDTAPILERSWASAAGLGFGGKNCLQIVPARTSWMFLAVLFLDLEVPPDAPLRDHCGRCTRCLTGCPTQAFAGPRSLDARRCIAYWTIEARGIAPRELRRGFGRWAFGCDVCQEVCPHNAAPPPADEDDLLPRHAWLDLPELLATPDQALMDRFLGTPLRRPGAAGLKRNALLVLANLGQPAGLAAAEAAMEHPDDVVRAAAVWCLQELGAPPAAHHRAAGPLEEAELTAAAAPTGAADPHLR